MMLGDTCYTIRMTDSYGDGWNGGKIEIYEAGNYMDAVTLSSGFEDTAEYCGTEDSSIEFYFTEGSWTNEIGYTIYEPDGTEMVSVPQGSAAETGVPTASGTVVIPFEFIDTDCDDTDPAINPDASEVCDGLDNNVTVLLTRVCCLHISLIMMVMVMEIRL